MKTLEVLQRRLPAPFTLTRLSRDYIPLYCHSRRQFKSTISFLADSSIEKRAPLIEPKSNVKPSLPPLSVLPLPFLLRSLFITSILTSPRLLSPCLSLMRRLCDSRSPLLNPDRNPVLHAVLRTLFYNQYCAGENETEVRRTVATIKNMGFCGVILGYAKEMIVEPGSARVEANEAGINAEAANHVIEQWREGTMRTLEMIGEGDFLAVKLTGAGPVATEALLQGKPPPARLWEGLVEICDAAAVQGTVVWIDAEQQAFQDAIDAWTTTLMKKYNQDGKAVVYNTHQAYLKSTPANIAKHMELASKEGWIFGIKLVRGAYIASEPRHLIHDTKADTDAAYDGIVENILSRTFPSIPDGAPFPKVRLFLASHNRESVRKAHALHRSRTLSGLPTLARLEYGQLQGMADDVSCGLLQECKAAYLAAGPESHLEKQIAPRAFKCLSWGTTVECLQFLLRRAVENKDAVERTRRGLADSRAELWRRVKSPFGL